MPFQIVRNDIVQMQVDAIVNSANPQPVIGAGTDAGIHMKAGEQLLDARRRIGRIAPGEAAVTPGYNLDARFVIHTVGPVWQGGTAAEAETLRSCYLNSLNLAARLGCESVAFPLISSGNYGYPREQALQIAIDCFRDFLEIRDMQIYLVVFDRESYHLSGSLFTSVASFIDEHYVQEKRKKQSFSGLNGRLFRRKEAIEALPEMEARCEETMDYAAETPMHPMVSYGALAPMAAEPLSLDDLLEQTDAGFSETLLTMIDRTGKKDSEIYKKANVDRKLFSKIRNDPFYQPSKTTALAFAIALELDLEETKSFIARAGYALTRSSKLDTIVEYCIRTKCYDIMKINLLLFDFDQKLLGTA